MFRRVCGQVFDGKGTGMNAKLVLMALIGVVGVSMVLGGCCNCGDSNGEGVAGRKGTIENWAVLQGRVERGEVDVNATDKDGLTLMHKAARAGRIDILEWLKERGGDVNASMNGITPMHIAAIHGRIDVMAWLWEQGADVNAESDAGSTPMHSAVMAGRLDVMQWLKEHGAEVKGKFAGNHIGGTLMHDAALGGHVDILAWMQEQGLDVNVRNEVGFTPMHSTAVNGQIAAMAWLKDQGADINAQTHRRATPLDITMEYDRKKAEMGGIVAKKNTNAKAAKWLRANGAQ